MFTLTSQCTTVRLLFLKVVNLDFKVEREDKLILDLSGGESKTLSIS